MTEITKIFCDICGKQIDDQKESLHRITIRKESTDPTFIGTTLLGIPKRVVVERLELCGKDYLDYCKQIQLRETTISQ